MKLMVESRFRMWLAQQIATKLFIKAFIDLCKLDLLAFKNSALGWLYTIKCHVSRLFKNKKSVECNFCGWNGNVFFPHVTSAVVRLNEKCPICHSIPRYRSLMKFLIEEFNIFDQKLKILEIGPNRSLQNLLIKTKNIDYISVDLKSPQAMIHMDITDLKFEDESFDLLFCISVMQYVKDDEKGFGEMFRILKTGGKIVFASGINEKMEKTVEFKKRTPQNNFTIRMYGWDVKEKILSAGFKIKLYNPYNSSSEYERKRYGLGSHTFFLLTK